MILPRYQQPGQCAVEKRRGQNFSRLLVHGIFLVAGCSDEETPLPSIRYETNEAIIGTAFDEPLCGGDLAHIDERIRYLEETFDARSDSPVEIYLYREKPPQCTIFGCFVGDEYIASQWTALDHELVHAVIENIADPTSFWSEGNAVAHSGRRTQMGTVGIAEQVDLDARSIDYLSAGHFVRWLVEEKGGAGQIRRLLQREPFLDVFGATLEQEEMEFLATAPWSYPPIFPCSGPELSGPDGQWNERVDVDCESDDTFSRTGVCAVVLRSFEVLEPGPYELLADGGFVRLMGCQMDILENDPGPASGDVPFEYESTLSIFRAFEPNVVHELQLDAGLYEVTVESCDLENAGVVEVQLTEAGG